MNVTLVFPYMDVAILLISKISDCISLYGCCHTADKQDFRDIPGQFLCLF